MQFDVAPGLSFTKPLKATIDGKNVPSPRWAKILLTMIKQVKAKSGLDGDKLARELGVPAKAERFEEEGFKYHPDQHPSKASPLRRLGRKLIGLRRNGAFL